MATLLESAQTPNCPNRRAARSRCRLPRHAIDVRDTKP
jgi:hypothetical protein